MEVNRKSKENTIKETSKEEGNIRDMAYIKN
jgi:hypothetical protein